MSQQDHPVRSSVHALPKRGPVELEQLVEDLVVKVAALADDVTKEARIVRSLLGEILARLPEKAMRDPQAAVDEAANRVPDER